MSYSCVCDHKPYSRIGDLENHKKKCKKFISFEREINVPFKQKINNSIPEEKKQEKKYKKEKITGSF